MGWRAPGKFLIAVVAVQTTLAGCAKEDAAPIVFDSTPPDTTTPATLAPPEVQTVPPATAEQTGASGEWIDATGNLAGLESECQNLSYVSVRPDGSGLIAGVALQGLWSSEDRGETWTQLGQAEGSETVNFRLTKVLYDPEDADRIWFSGAFTGYGVYRSDDAGGTFDRLGDVFHVGDISVDFTDPTRQTLVAPQYEGTELYRSRDGGVSWEEVNALPENSGQAGAAVVVDEETYLLGVRRGAAPGIYRTTDAGSTWTRVQPVDVTGTPLHSEDGALYWLLDRGSGITRSTDDGVTWETIPSSNISPFAVSLVELPDGSLATLSDSALIISADKGITWQSVDVGLPYDPSGLTYSPSDEAFYVWLGDCDYLAENPVRPGAIMRLDYPVGSVPTT